MPAAEKKRDNLLDMIRGVGILIVVFGHSIQKCRCSSEFDWLHMLIASFQMVLLFIISGYSWCLGSDEKFGGLIRKRIMRLGVPHIVWVTICYMLSLCSGSAAFSIKQLYIECKSSDFWFLRDLFFLMLAFDVVKVSIKRFEQKILKVIAFVVSIVLIIVVYHSVGIFNSLHFAPAFAVGGMVYWLRKRFGDHWIRWATYLSVPVTAVCIYILLCVKDCTFTYFIDKLIAFSFSFTIILLVGVAWKLLNRIGATVFADRLSIVGQMTLPIYAIHCQLFIHNGIVNWHAIMTKYELGIYQLSFIVFVIWSALSIIMTLIFRKYKLTRMILCGEK